ncbi:MAG: hypothetical protein MUO62_17040 [Anaerolineales bacterium]|nr:hypothetical protein [Anaerolineales bacterium]
MIIHIYLTTIAWLPLVAILPGRLSSATRVSVCGRRVDVDHLSIVSKIIIASQPYQCSFTAFTGFVTSLILTSPNLLEMEATIGYSNPVRMTMEGETR